MLDVRSTNEYVGEHGHIAGSLNLPLEELETRLDTLRGLSDKPIAIVCHTHRRSQKAARLLARQGFSDVHVVRGGMMAWHAAGEPVSLDQQMQEDRHA